MSAFHAGLQKRPCTCCSLGLLPHSYLTASVCCGWDLQEGKFSRRRQPPQLLINTGNMHPSCCPVPLCCPCRARQLAGETFIQLPSLEQRCTCLGAELIVLGHFTPTMRSTVTAFKCLIQKQTPGWTPLQLQCFLKAGGAIQHVSVGLLGDRGSGRRFLPASEGECGCWVEMGVSKGSAEPGFSGKLLLTKESCIQPCT